MNEIKSTFAFIATAEELSFTKAARKLDLSPQAVAASVARLETALDVRLFNRTTRTLALTEEGHALHARIAPSLLAFKNALASVRDLSETPTGLLRVSTASAFGRRYVLPRLPQFRKRYPNVRVEVSFDDHKVDIVREGFDLAIRGGNIADSSLITRRICGLEAICVASPAYLARAGVPQSPDELHQHQIIALKFASGAYAPWDFRVRGKPRQFIAQDAAIILSDTEGVGEAAVGGLGIARVSLHFAWEHLKAGRLKVVLHKFNDPGKREVVIHYPHREHVAPRVKAFVEFFLETLKKEPGLAESSGDLAAFVV
jgi:DNA-binding transcriptional LysR family regulator